MSDQRTVDLVISVEAEDDAVRLVLSGSASGPGGRLLDEALLVALKETEGLVKVDLAGLEALDVESVQRLADALSRLPGAMARVEIVNADGPTKAMLERSGFAGLIAAMQ